MSKKDIDNVSFCNTRAKCLNIKENCDSVEINRKKMKQELLNSIVKNFDNAYTANMKDQKEKIKNLLTYYKTTIELLKNIERIRAYLYNNKQVEIVINISTRDKTIPICRYTRKSIR